VPARCEGRLRAVRARIATPLTRIGVLTADRACVLHDAGTDRPLPDGFVHFAARTG
jgi:hypothetical protein